MRKTLLMTTGLAWLALTGAAGAVSVTLKPGPANPDYFVSAPATSGDFNIGTTVWSGTGKTETGSLQGQYAAPLGMTNQYMAVTASESEMATFATPQSSITIYWGSIDPGNEVALSINGYTLTGSDLATIYGANDDGSQASIFSNQWVTISGLGEFSTATFTSSTNSFEFSLSSGVPEISTWAMMGLGFAGLGYAAFRRNTRGRALAI